MTAVLIILGVLLLLLFLSGLVFELALIRRGVSLKPPHKGGVVSPMLAPTGEELWAYNIPKLKAFNDMEPETLHITSNDRLRLSANLHRGSSDITVICFHGYKSAAVYDFCAISEMYRDMGANLVFPDMRADGDSEGRCIGFGVLGSADVCLWGEKVRKLLPDTSR